MAGRRKAVGAYEKMAIRLWEQRGTRRQIKWLRVQAVFAAGLLLATAALVWVTWALLEATRALN